MEKDTELCREILNDFLDRWPEDVVRHMTLEEYVSTHNKDTFCQWLETQTIALGSIKGINSIKFGIYKRSAGKRKQKNHANDSEYTWQKFYGDTKQEAFNNVKAEILIIIRAANNGHWNEVDKLHLTNFVKWKIAYLYSNERLIPIFKKDILHAIAKHYGLSPNKKTDLSTIQELIISNKPAHLTIYEFADALFTKFGTSLKRGNKGNNIPSKRTRRAAKSRNTNTQIRRGASSYIATQKHNILQQKLETLLIDQYGKANVLIEEDYVDVKLLEPNKITLYEVKADSFASGCIREALGQVLLYAQGNTDPRIKKIVIVGQYPPNAADSVFIQYLKGNLKIEFEYMYVAIS